MKKYTLLENTPDILDSVVDTIKKAEKYVYIQFMTFEGDKVGERMAEAIFEAREKGVEIYIMIDIYTELIISDKLVFFPHRPWRMLEIFKEERKTHKLIKDFAAKGVHIKWTNPIKWYNPKSFLERDHRKIVLADSKVLILGGFNVSEHNYQWHDVAGYVTDKSMVKVIKHIFEAKFHHDFTQFNTIEEHGIKYMQSNESVLIELRERVRNAKERILLESPYFDDDILLELAHNKFKEGVEVRFIFPKENNHKPYQKMHNSYHAKYGGLIHFREIPYPMTHAKIALVDNTVTFGSANFYHMITTELNAFVENKEFAEEVYEYFKKPAAPTI